MTDARAANGPRPANGGPVPGTDQPTGRFILRTFIRRRPGLLVAACIVALAAGALGFRLPRLAMRPMHGDEANQAKKAATLAGLVPGESGYHYDPQEHHGPTLYWLTLPSLWLSGAKDFAQTAEKDYRVVPVVFGAGLILLLLLVADGLGRGAAIAAGLLVAVSPAMVFYSRYYVQEMLLVFFTLAAIGCAWRFWQSGSLGWAVATGASLGLMHATKETWVLAAAAAAAGLLLSALWSRMLDGKGDRSNLPGHQPPVGRGPKGASHKLDLSPFPRAGPILAAVAAACAVTVALYSSFGANWRGPLDSILAYETYWHRGSESGIHNHPWDFYLKLLVASLPVRRFVWMEGLVLGLAAVGCLFSLSLRERVGVRATGAAARAGNPPHPDPVEAVAFRRFLVFYTLVLTGLYAAIPYKTPWCMLSFLHGMILLAGVGAWAIVGWRAGWMPKWLAWPLRSSLALLLAAAAVHLGWQSYVLNFRAPFYADQRNPYVYAHSATDVVNLAERMEELAAVSPEGHGLVIQVVTPDNYWPLPWYLRQFHDDRVGYWQDAALWWKDTHSYPPPSVIILTPDVQEAVGVHLRGAYNQQMIYRLRPEVFVSVYVREDLWQKFLSAASSRADH
jgi:uncharacterized protein (TIGR03663 family)